MKPFPKTLAILPLVASLAACGGKHEAPAGQAALQPVSAAVGNAEAREVPQRLELYGTVMADKVSAVGSRVMASVIAVPVKAGDLVAAGQVLVEIDPQTARGQEAQARGALAQAKAGLALAERNHQRFQALQKSGSASDLELDLARMQYEQAKGAVEQANGAVEAASSVAKESKVVAPFAGRVAQTLVEAGDLAAPGRPLVLLESALGRRLVVNVPESIAASSGLAVGKVLPVSIDSMPGSREIKGTVVEMSPGSDPASHSFTAKLELAGATVPTGLTGRALLASGSKKAVVVPESAIVRQGGMTLVVVVDEQGKARSRAVTTGPADGGLVEVLSGLSGGEKVLVGLPAAPKDGAPVNASAEVKK